jgi:hypothetical protein
VGDVVGWTVGLEEGCTEGVPVGWGEGRPEGC